MIINLFGVQLKVFKDFTSGHTIYTLSTHYLHSIYTLSTYYLHSIYTSGYGSCDYRTGSCECSPGFTGPLCSDPCPAGNIRRGCTNCKCTNKYKRHGFSDDLLPDGGPIITELPFCCPDTRLIIKLVTSVICL